MRKLFILCLNLARKGFTGKTEINWFKGGIGKVINSEHVDLDSILDDGKTKLESVR